MLFVPRNNVIWTLHLDEPEIRFPVGLKLVVACLDWYLSDPKLYVTFPASLAADILFVENF